MPGKVKVKIIAGRNLPVMDRSSDTTDAYVEIKLGNTTYKTDVCRKSLNPQWNSEWYRFEVDDSELQDEPLQIRLMDHDTYSANDAIGKVYMNLNPLLIPAGAIPTKYGWSGESNVDQPSSSVMSGWIPVYDTMHGIRGEVNVTVKVELFSDFNKFRQSSCGVQFFCSPVIPHGFHAQVIHGFIEELVVNDDPEYQWIDKIRTPRASNEARQTLFFKLSGELQRKIGVKALDLGGNAVIGYNQCFDLEGESGIVARGIGTVVTLIKHHEMQQQLDIGIAEEKALSYLKFLAFDNGLKLENDNVFERFTQSSPIPNTSIFVSTSEQLTRPSPRRSTPTFLRQSSQPLIEYEPLPGNLKTCISSRSLSNDIREEIALRQMLRQEEMKGASNVGLSRKIKYFKQNMLYKKMNVLKTKLSDASMQESLNLDTASIDSGRDTIRTSLIDLRELRKKRKQSNSSYMAELLVKSVIHAHTSLDCIVECHDSGPPHATSTSALNEDAEEDSSHKSSESQNTVLEVAPVVLMNKTISEPYLLLPDTAPVTPSMNSSSDSDMSSSDGSDSPSEIKDKLDFDTVSLIVKTVQDEENKQRRLSLVHNLEQDSATAPVLLSNNNFFEFPVNSEKPIDQIVQNAILSDTLQPVNKEQFNRSLSRSCTDITVINELKNNSEFNKSDINKTESTTVMLSTDIEKKIEKLRYSALFRSIAERPKNKLNKTFSISCEDISTTTNENFLPPNTAINLPKPEKKRRLSKALSVSCEEMWSPNIVEIEKRIDKLRDSALFKSINKKPEPRKRGKLQRTFSISCDDEIDNLDNKPVELPVDIEKKIENLMLSPLFSNNEKRKKGKMNRALSRSCADISSPNINEENAHLLSNNVNKKLKMFKNSPLFKISILGEPPGKINTASTDISSSDRMEINKSKNIEKKLDMFKNSPLFKISILVEPKPKGKMNKELSRSYTDITTADKYDDNKENNSKSNPDLTNIPLVKAAMHTMLTEKINLLTSQPAPISPRSSEQLLFTQSNPNVADNSLIQNAMQTILMEKVDLMTAQHAPVSKRVQEEFKKSVANSFSRSDPDITSHFIKSTVNKIHLFPAKSPSYLRKARGSYTGSLKTDTFNSDSNLLDHTSVKSLIMDKIHMFTSKSPSLSRKFNGENEPSPTHSEVNGNSLVKTAMETILMEKLNILTPPISSDGEKEFYYPNLPASSQPDIYDTHDQVDQHCEDRLIDKVNIMTPISPSVSPVTEEPSLKSSKHPHLDKIKTTVHHVFDKVHILSPKSTDKKFFAHESEPSLMKTAMQTMLIDKVNIISPDAAALADESNHDETIQSKHEHLNIDKIKAVVHTVQDKISSLSPTLHGNKFDFDKEKESEPSLMKTAMQAMLIDKVNIISPEASSVAVEEPLHNETKYTKHEHLNLDKVKEAVHTVIEKVSSLSPTSPKHGYKFEFNTEPEPSLTKTAMQTMLIDKVNILSPEASAAVAEDNHDSSEKHETKHEHLDKMKSVVHNVLEKVHHLPSLHHKDKKVEEHDEENQSLMKTAMQTMLLDKVNIIAPNSPSMSTESKEFQYEQNMTYKSIDPKYEPENESIENKSLVKTAMQTMLMEQVNIGSPKSVTNSYPTQEQATHSAQSSSKSDSGKKHSLFSTIKNKCKSLKSKLTHKDSHKHKAKEDGLVESAMSTMLMDRVNIMSSSDHDTPTSPNPFESPPKAYNKQKLDITLTAPSTEEPNISIRPDTGDSCNRTTAVTADDANCNTNAEHAPCLYTSDRRIVESPVSTTERDRERDRDRENIRERHGHQRTESTGGKMSQSPARLNTIPCIHRRSSDSDLSITPKGNSLTGSDRSGGTIPGYHHIRNALLRPTVDNFDMMEYPFLTMSKYPPGFILHLGGAVSARSVKLLERITNIEEPETRDTWWSELRMEIRTHSRALNCNAVLGYTESTSICDEVCVLSASGTAAVIALYSGELSDGVSGLPNLYKPHIPNKDLMTSSLDRTDFERDKNSKHPEAANTNNKIIQVTASPEHEATIEFSGSTSAPSQPTCCRICHIPYSESTMSFRINMLYCSICKMAKVPDILLTTIEMPEGLPITGRGCFLQSYVCRPKRDLKGELNAKEISESLPFLEYELHRLLVNKMKVKAMNTIFGLKVRITIGERMLIGVATGTAVFLLPLPPPPLPKLIAGNSTTEERRLADMQKLLVDTVKKNKEIYELKDIDVVQPSKLLSDAEESDDEKSNIDLGAGNKDSCVLEVDDSEDIEVINLLVEPRPPDGFHVVNTENVPGLEELEIVKNLQMFTQVWRAKIPLNQSASHFGKHFQKLLQSVYFKLRRMIPCALCDLQFRVDLPEPDEIQLTLLGMALGLGDPLKLNKYKRKNHLPSKDLCKKSDDELIFNLEEDHVPEFSIPVISQGSLNTQMSKHRQKSPQRLRSNTKQRHTPVKERHGVDITPLSYVPGGKIERYLGYLNFFFIRETTSIREGGGLSGFVHSFITEVLAIVRAHVTALGGNAMVAYFMTECVLYHNAHKNQGQCLINVGGDVVFVSYFTEDN